LLEEVVFDREPLKQLFLDEKSQKETALILLTHKFKKLQQ